MEVRDLSWNEAIRNRSNNPLLPKSIRGLIVGKSGCGKTTLLLNLLLRPDWLDYNHLQVFGKSLFQPEYRILKKAFEEKLPKSKIIKLFDNQDQYMGLDIPLTHLVEYMAKTQDKTCDPDIDKDIDCKFFQSSEDVPDTRGRWIRNRKI